MIALSRLTCPDMPLPTQHAAAVSHDADTDAEALMSSSTSVDDAMALPLMPMATGALPDAQHGAGAERAEISVPPRVDIAIAVQSADSQVEPITLDDAGMSGVAID